MMETQSNAMLARYLDSMIEAYWLCEGDAEAMTEWLMQTFMADVAHTLRDKPPLCVGNDPVRPLDELRNLVAFLAEQAVEIIEGLGKTRH